MRQAPLSELIGDLRAKYWLRRSRAAEALGKLGQGAKDAVPNHPLPIAIGLRLDTFWILADMENRWHLAGTSISIDFRVNEDNWCTLVLREGGRSIVLGAEDRTIVITRLLRAFSHDSFPELRQEWDGMRFGYLLTLAEMHTSIYARPSRAGVQLSIHADGGAVLARFNLDAEQCDGWRAALQQQLASE